MMRLERALRVRLPAPPVRYCAVEGCRSRFYAKRWCAYHYQRARKFGGDPLAPPRARTHYPANPRPRREPAVYNHRVAFTPALWHAWRATQEREAREAASLRAGIDELRQSLESRYAPR